MNKTQGGKLEIATTRTVHFCPYSYVRKRIRLKIIQHTKYCTLKFYAKNANARIHRIFNYDKEI